MILLICVCLAVMVSLVIWLSERDKGPVYQGKSLSEWLVIYDANVGRSFYENDTRETPGYYQAVEAITSMGTNAVPFLLNWIQYVPPKWKVRFLSGTWKLPMFIRNTAFARWLVDDQKLVNAGLAVSGFRVLGPQAGSALADLTALLKSARSGETAAREIEAIACLGSNALPALLTVLTNSADPYFSFNAAMAIGSMGTNARPAIPVLIECLQRDNPTVVCYAAITLGKLHLEPDLVVPALAKALQSRSDNFNWKVHMGIITGLESYRAVGELEKMLDDPHDIVRSYVTNVLRIIAPEVLAAPDGN